MTGQLQRVRPAEIEWEMLGTHGLRRKVLGYDPETQHITSLVDIPRGWKGGGVAHFHHAFEEVFMVEGSVTLNGRHYWHGGDYFYRPAHVVHGHDEKSPEGALALVRSDGPLELLLIHEPDEDDEYPLPEEDDARGHVRHVVTADVESVPDPQLPEGWTVRPLSADPVTGARTVIVDVPAGWTSQEASARDAEWEAMVIEGAIEGESGRFEARDYCRGPAGTEVFGARSSEAGCSFILWLFGRDG